MVYKPTYNWGGTSWGFDGMGLMKPFLQLAGQKYHLTDFSEPAITG
jgi:hypothetical protein